MKTPYTAKDIRFTAKGDAVYVYLMAWPEDGKDLIRSLATPAGKVASVELLGGRTKPSWLQTDQGLAVQLPVTKPGRFAFGLKVTGDRLRAASISK